MKILEFLKDKNNKLSILRLGILIGFICSAFLIVGGAICFFTDRTGVEIVLAGTGLFAALGIEKALQKKYEE